jgi:hypothetical protein
LRTNPGTTAAKFEALAAKHEIPRKAAREFLGNGILPGGGLRREALASGNGHKYYLDVQE